MIPLDPRTREVPPVGDRARAYCTVRQHLDRLGIEVVSGTSPADAWCKADAVADALAHTDADMIIVHDADVIVQLAAIEAAVSAVDHGVAEWSIPHNLVHRLDEDSTKVVLATGTPSVTRQLVRWPYVGMVGGGVVVMRRETYDDCPLDPRFKGWGSEDQSWGFALESLHGAPWRGSADLFHLWHPHAEPGAQRSPLFASERLRRAYRAYRERPELMRGLVDEAKVLTGRVGPGVPSQPPR